jgi:carboxymethylenebutenolidase
MQKEHVSIQVPDGTVMNAYRVIPEGKGPFGKVIVFQEAYGVNHHIRSITERMAEEGYLAIAPELFHRSARPGFESGYTDFNLVMPHVQKLTPQGLDQDIQATFDWLEHQPNGVRGQTASIGFCLGGRASVMANSLLPLAASVSFYGGHMVSVTDRIKNLHGPQLFIWGGRDKHILPEQIQTVLEAVKEAEKPYANLVISYADHGFNCDERASYHPKAAREAWALAMAFLKNNLEA